MFNKGNLGTPGLGKLNANMSHLLRFYGGRGSCSSRFTKLGAKLDDLFHGAAAAASSSTDLAAGNHKPLDFIEGC